jgi:hypothetical protein
VCPQISVGFTGKQPPQYHGKQHQDTQIKSVLQLHSRPQRMKQSCNLMAPLSNHLTVWHTCSATHAQGVTLPGHNRHSKRMKPRSPLLCQERP